MNLLLIWFLIIIIFSGVFRYRIEKFFNKYSRLLRNLKNDVNCRIKPSKVQGVGVFAIKDIPKNTILFKTPEKCFNGRNLIKIKSQEIDKLQPNIKSVVKDFHYNQNNNYYIPSNGPNSFDMSFYVNHSDKHNVIFTDDHDCEMSFFKTIKKIKEGDEILANYNLEQQHADKV